MARQARIELAGGMHHITAKSPSRRVLFTNTHERQRYLELFAREVRDREWRALTYCLMTNHLHLLVQTPEPDLGAGFKRIHERFAAEFNRHHDESGHVFGARFYSGLVMTDRHAIACLRYIARNPVDAGMCAHPRDWEWGAHRALAGAATPPGFLDVAAAYRFFSPDDRAARRAYVELVNQSNAGLLRDLERCNPTGWLLQAVDDYAVPIIEIAGFLGTSPSTVYRRIVRARATQGTDP